jgi:hypothetical protein
VVLVVLVSVLAWVWVLVAALVVVWGEEWEVA